MKEEMMRGKLSLTMCALKGKIISQHFFQWSKTLETLSTEAWSSSALLSNGESRHFLRCPAKSSSKAVDPCWPHRADEEDICCSSCCQFAPVLSHHVVHCAELPLTLSIACRQWVHRHEQLPYLVRNASASCCLVFTEPKVGLFFTQMSPHL